MGKPDEIIRLIDYAIVCARSLILAVSGTSQEWMADDATLFISKLLDLKDRTLAGTLPPSHGAGLGFTRELDEWAPNDLYSAGKAVEDFYRANWN